MNQETKVGLFFLLSLAAILGGILFLGDVQLFSHRHSYFVEFDDVQALPPKAAVKISGVEVGKVKSIQLVAGRARVEIGVEPGILIYQNGTASIGSTGIIGTRFVDIRPGTPESPLLESGSIIQGLKGSTLNNTMDSIAALFEDDEKYGNIVENLKATVSNIRRISESLNVALGNHSQDLEQIVLNVRDLTENTKVFTNVLAELGTEKKMDLKVTIEKLRGITTKLDDVMERITAGKGTIGALVTDEETAKNMKSAVASIKETAGSASQVFGRFTKFKFYWDYRYRYDFRDKESRSDGNITIAPRLDKFYTIGATNIGDPIADESHQAYERKNRINAYMGGTWGAFTGYAGAIRSAGGVGFSVKPLWKIKPLQDLVRLTGEVTDFSRDRVVKGNRIKGAWVAVGAEVSPIHWLRVGVRNEDILERPAVLGYANVLISDDDIAYLLGLATLGKP